MSKLVITSFYMAGTHNGKASHRFKFHTETVSGSETEWQIYIWRGNIQGMEVRITRNAEISPK